MKNNINFTEEYEYYFGDIKFNWQSEEEIISLFGETSKLTEEYEAELYAPIFNYYVNAYFRDIFLISTYNCLTDKLKTDPKIVDEINDIFLLQDIFPEEEELLFYEDKKRCWEVYSNGFPMGDFFHLYKDDGEDYKEFRKRKIANTKYQKAIFKEVTSKFFTKDFEDYMHKQINITINYLKENDLLEAEIDEYPIDEYSYDNSTINKKTK